MVNVFTVVGWVAFCICAIAYTALRLAKPQERLTKHMRRVRLHLQSGVLVDTRGRIEQLPGVTIEGLLAGTRQVGTIQHYVLYEPRVLEKDGSRVVGTTVSGHMEVPAGRVEAVEAMSTKPLETEETG